VTAIKLWDELFRSLRVPFCGTRQAPYDWFRRINLEQSAAATVNPSLIFFVKMAAFAVCTQSRFGGGHDDIAGLIGCGVNA
jgi:hypothetical protein